MTASIEERDRILRLVELGQVTAREAAQLLDALELEHARSAEQIRNRIVRIRVTNPTANRQKVNLTAVIPVNLIKISLRLGVRLLPQMRGSALEDLVRAIEEGATGRLLDIQDLEEGERVEIIVE